MRTTSCTPSIISMSPGSGRFCPTTPSTVRETPVDRWTSMPRSTSRATTLLICSSPASSSITTTMLSVSILSGTRTAVRFAVHDSTLQPSPFVDDPLEQPHNRLGVERSLARDAPDVVEHLLLAFRLVHFHVLLLLQASNLARAARPLVQQTHQHFVHAIDIATQ